MADTKVENKKQDDSIKMPASHVEERIGQAWHYHRQGDNEKAIEIFRDILDKNPQNIDARYGLGLALRASDRKEKAIDQFREALKLAEKALEAVDTTSFTIGHQGGNDLATYDDDRFMMLIRMISQRLEEMGIEPKQ